jgi:hypothetical protein
MPSPLDQYIAKRIGAETAPLDSALRKRVAELGERAEAKRKKNPPAEPIVNPTEYQIERMIECSCGTGPDRGFRRSCIVGGKHYVVTSGCWGSKAHNHYSEFGLKELLPPWTPGCDKIVTRDGTNETYALGKTVYWRKGKLYPKPLRW